MAINFSQCIQHDAGDEILAGLRLKFAQTLEVLRMCGGFSDLTRAIDHHRWSVLYRFSNQAIEVPFNKTRKLVHSGLMLRPIRIFSV